MRDQCKGRGTRESGSRESTKRHWFSNLRWVSRHAGTVRGGKFCALIAASPQQQSRWSGDEGRARHFGAAAPLVRRYRLQAVGSGPVTRGRCRRTKSRTAWDVGNDHWLEDAGDNQRKASGLVEIRVLGFVSVNSVLEFLVRRLFSARYSRTHFPAA